MERKAAVLRVLQQNDLSAWARNYWGVVYDRITFDEDHYNARIVAAYGKLEVDNC